MNTYSPRSEIDIDLGKYLLVLKRRWLPAALIFGAVTAIATLYAVTREPTYQASGKVLVKLDRTPSLAGLDVPGGTSIGEPNAVGLQSDPIATEVEAIFSLGIAEETISALSLKDDDGNLISPEDFFSVLDVKPIPGTDMIRIGYESNDPELAADIVNKVIEVYRENNSAEKRAEASAAREFIVKQLPKTEESVRQAEAALREFKERNQVVVLAEESLETVQALKQIENEISQTRAQLATASAQSQDLQQRLGMGPQQALQASALSQSPAIQETFTQIRDVQGQLDLARARYQPTHPTITSLKRQENRLLDRLEERVESVADTRSVSEKSLNMSAVEQDLTANLLQAEVERVGLTNRINELVQLQADQRERANVFPRLEATQRELERRLNAAQSTYEALLQRLQEVQVAQNQTIDNIKVVSQALVPEDSSSSKKLIVAGGALIGSILAVITAFALDLSDRTVKTVREAQESLELPILGVIPVLAKQLPFTMRPSGTEMDVMAQAYRMLQANLSFVSSKTGCKTIVITSAIAQEGRSRVAANLAISMAQAGARVLLVDADLGKPSQHEIWGCQNQQGLAQILAEDIQLDQVIEKVDTNLSLLPAGQPINHSLSTFNAKRISTFIQLAAQKFDIVLFDTPPLTQAADASTLGTLVDGTLMVVRPKHVENADLKAAYGLMQLSGQRVLGMVINGVERINSPSQYFAYEAEKSQLYPQRRLTVPASYQAAEIDTLNGREVDSSQKSLI